MTEAAPSEMQVRGVGSEIVASRKQRCIARKAPLAVAWSNLRAMQPPAFSMPQQ